LLLDKETRWLLQGVFRFLISSAEYQGIETFQGRFGRLIASMPRGVFAHPSGSQGSVAAAFIKGREHNIQI
jgi:hypothetical protein